MERMENEDEWKEIHKELAECVSKCGSVLEYGILRFSGRGESEAK
jgi:hypothetical protein